MKDREIKIRVSEEERDIIIEKAELAGVKMSQYVRVIALNGEINSRHDKAVIVDLFKLKGELARLGNLFKLAVKTQTFIDNKLMAKISKTIGEIQEKISQLK